MSEHRAQGRGTRTFPDGSRYEGDYDEGERTGQGSFHAANGDVYIGSWSGNKREGTRWRESTPLAVDRNSASLVVLKAGASLRPLGKWRNWSHASARTPLLA
jgi:hypothetical protein